MYKSLLRLGIIVTIIFVLLGWFYCYRYYYLEEPLWQQLSFRPWLLFSFVINFIGIFVISAYFKIKGYKNALAAMVAITISAIYGFIVAYQAIGSGAEAGLNDHIAYGSAFLTNSIFAWVLINSKVSERPYLKTLGKVLFIYLPVELVLYLLYFTTADGGVKASVDHAFGWLEPIGFAIAILEILNYVSELRESPKE